MNAAPRRLALRLLPIALLLLPFVLHAASAFVLYGDDEDPVGLIPGARV